MNIDLTGRRFGRLVVLEKVKSKDYKKYKTKWKCKCDCGNIIETRANSLLSGITKSCGCLAKELVSQRASKHNGFGTRLYTVWNSMRQRCNNPNNQAYNNYGGRGISICKEWDDFNVFRDWAINSGYDEDAEYGKYTLERIDVNKGYCPENCTWATMKEQSRNKRNTLSVAFKNETHPLTEWAEILGIKYSTLHQRYKNGLPPEEILKITT